MATPAENTAVTEEVPNVSEPSMDQPQASTDTLKRKASPEESSNANETNPPKRPHQDPAQAAENARSDEKQRKPAVSSVQDEKKRNKRLFGGLLSTLSQSASNNPAQKRRLEIERRQQERLQKQKDEDERLRRERGGRRETGRNRDGVSWEEEKMQNRHRRMLGQARFLKTKARPTVYYLPAKPTAQHDERIEEQIRSTQRLIEREEDEFEERRRAHNDKSGRPRSRDMQPEPISSMAPQPPEAGSSNGRGAERHTVEEPSKEEPALRKSTTTTRPTAEEKHTHGDQEESGDEVMDAEEDMVIY
ncbi:pinin/SDK/memA/ protein conserved region domain-containing protein [Sarocladium implicatum]|nr:pinin/SDK/memA/ protein conserved region domain-containing protein [Sarocladium implicatum]